MTQNEGSSGGFADRKYLLLGVTGGIASGKSAVSACLTRRGARVICADELSRAVVQPGQAALRDICEAFGNAMRLPDGGLDRKRLGARIFSDPEARARLNALMHPRIAQAAKAALAALSQSGFCGVAVLDAALLIEAGWASWVDEVWLVKADPAIRLRRLMARDGCDREAALRRMHSQATDAWREKHATRILHNDGDLRDLERQVQSCLAAALAAAGKAPRAGGQTASLEEMD